MTLPLPTDPRKAALDAACAAIDAAFGEAAIIARHKAMARTALRSLSGSLHATAFLTFVGRYEGIVSMLPEDFAAALRKVESMLVLERSLHRRKAEGDWFLRPSRTRLAILTESRMLLRWMRRRGQARHWGAVIEALIAPVWARAAAE